jgi:hypothetical protein
MCPALRCSFGARPGKRPVVRRCRMCLNTSTWLRERVDLRADAPDAWATWALRVCGGWTAAVAADFPTRARSKLLRARYIFGVNVFYRAMRLRRARQIKRSADTAPALKHNPP